MQFTLNLIDSVGAVAAPVTVETEPDLSLDRLAAELSQARGLRDPAELYRGRRPLDPRQTVYTAGLRDGYALGLGTEGPEEDEPAGLTEVRVVGGTGAGTIYRLPVGEYDLGSAPACRLWVAAPTPPLAARVIVSIDGTVLVRALSTGVRLSGASLSPEDQDPSAWLIGSQLAVGNTLLESATVARPRASVTIAEDGSSREFNRPPRFVPPVVPSKFRLPASPGAAPQQQLSLVTILLVPIVGSAVGVLATGDWKLIFLGILSPVGAVLSRTGSRKRTRADYEERVRAFEEATARARQDIEQALLTEQYALRLGHPDPAALLAIATTPSDRLWERRRRDPDFLELRIGTGAMPSRVQIDDPAQDENRRTSVAPLQEVPAAVPVSSAGVVGIVGPIGHAQWMVAEAAVLHSPLDLRIVVLTSAPAQESEGTWGWVRWLPHSRPQGEDAHVALGNSATSVARRVAELNALIAARAAADDATAVPGPAVLVVLDRARQLRALPGVIQLLREGPAVGVYTLCVDTDPRLLPEECRALVLADGPTVRLRVQDRPDVAGLRPDLPAAAWYDRVARGLAPLRVGGDGEDSALPSSARLLDLLSLEPPTADAVRAVWAAQPRSTRALLGVGLDGDFAVDLVRDGPHALIAGTTGSGKSELLQTLVATLAVANRPDEMTFVLVDYKGGSAFAECADLPHTVGLVTDLDTHLVERALVSLGAELRRRERQLAAAGAKDIADYTDRRRRDPSLGPMPRLMIVVDEFASMIRELPDFVPGIVNIAQRGRSLGIHMVLATQRPSGAVTGDIRANTNLRIALRTTDTSESRDIIDAPDSGQLSPRTPGRAYARLSASVLVPFQSGRIGGRRRSTGHDGAQAATATPLRTSEVAWTELGEPVPRARPAAVSSAVTEGEVLTDIAALVAAISEAAEAAGIARQPSPSLPPLPDTLTLDQLPPALASGRGLPAVAWGMVDLPAEQVQVPLAFDLDRAGHLHIAGAGRSGRSQALRTLAVALARAHGPQDLHLYGIDCGNGALRALTDLPHCGTVVDHRNPELLGRLLDQLGQQLRARQGQLGALGVADLAELRERAEPGERPAHIVVLVDRFEVFDRDFATFDNGSYVDRFLALVRDGASVGIHFVLAGDRVLGSSRYASTTEDKLVLRMNDASDWAMFGIRVRDVPEGMPAGRALRASDGVEVQVAVLPTGAEAPDTSGAGQAQAISAIAAELTRRHAAVPGRTGPYRLRQLPDQIDYETAAASARRDGPLWALVGVGGDAAVGMGVDLGRTPTFMIAGSPRSGVSTALLTVARSLLESGTELLVLAPRRSPLRDLAGREGVQVITDSDVPLARFQEAMREMHGDTAAVLVDDAELFLQAEIGPVLTALARGAVGEGWAIVTAGNAEALSNGIGGWAAQIRRNRTGLLLAPQSLGDGEAIGVRLSRGLIGQQPRPGRAYLHLGDNRLVAVQVPTAGRLAVPSNPQS